MIRFNCPNCARPYEVPDALAKLPLVCKQCGQRITPPERSEASPPLPPPPVAAPNPVPPPADQPSAGDVLFTKPDSTPDIDFNVGGPTASSLGDATRARRVGLSDANRSNPAELDDAPASSPEINLDLLPKAAPPRARPEPVAEAPPEAKPESTLLPFLADFAIFVLLIAVGILIGEQLAGKSTTRVISDAGSAAKFPPRELIVWACPPLLFGLAYLLLGSRELSVGAWLRRRARRGQRN